jgi:hypothetical protein
MADRGHPMTPWQQPAGGRDIHDEIAMEHLRAQWAEVYDFGFGTGDYRARCQTGGALLIASTPAGLDSAVRADWARRNAR